MNKKLLSCMIIFCLLFCGLSLPCPAENKTLIRMDSSNEGDFRVIGDGTLTGEGAVCSSNAANIAFHLRPVEAIPIHRMDLTIKCRFQITTDKEVDYFALRFYNPTSEAGSSYTVKKKPVSGEWYEEEFPLYQTKVSSGKRQFEVGDELYQLQLNVKNSAEANVRLLCEYIEIYEPDGADSYPEELKYINGINAKIADAKPGDVIEIDDGVYPDCELNITSKGTEEQPVTIRAKNSGKVIFTGNSAALVRGSYTVVDGLYFKGCTPGIVFQFMPGSSCCSLKNSAFVNCNGINLDSTSRYVYIQGEHHTVSGCYFREKNTKGQMLEIFRATDQADYHTVENNYFGYFESCPGNGYETVRVGTSPHSLSASESVFRNNFFERCSGEAEIISNKSCNNAYTNNTFYDCQGALTLRHGNDCIANGNLFIGGDATNRVTGIRVIGERHKLFDNYFFNMPSSSATVTVENGVPDGALASYAPVFGLELHNNTFIGGNRELWLGAYNSAVTGDNSNRTAAPEGTVSNNVFVTYKGTLPIIGNDDATHKVTLKNNSVYGKDPGYANGNSEGINYKDPGLKITADGFFRTSDGTGANLENLKNTPKNPFDVICDWVKRDFYDSGLYTFETTAIDPFNDKDADISKLFPSKDQINVCVNDFFIPFDVAPQLLNDRTMVPMRAIFENLSAKVDWDETTASATAVRGSAAIKITENSSSAFVNGKEVILDSPAVIIDGRFLVPIRFVSESFGAKVDWNEALQIVFIYLEGTKDNNIVTGPFPPKHNIPNALTVASVLQSGDDGDGSSIENTLDGREGTRWAVQDTGENPAFGIFDLGEIRILDQIMLSFYLGTNRVYTFSLEVSEDGIHYTPVLSHVKSSGLTDQMECFALNSAKAKYVKLIGEGNNSNKWTNISEIVFVGK